MRRIFGLHLWPGLPAGTVCVPARSPDGPVQRSHCHRGGHSVHLSRAAEGRDALTAGIAYLQRAYAMMDALPRTSPGSCASAKWSPAPSATPSAAKPCWRVACGPTGRTPSASAASSCRTSARPWRKRPAAPWTSHLSEGYPAVWNHEELYQKSAPAGRTAPALLEHPALAAEDFSFYQQYVPGVFFFLGVGDTAELHAPDFSFDDEAVLPGRCGIPAKTAAFVSRLSSGARRPRRFPTFYIRRQRV